MMDKYSSHFTFNRIVQILFSLLGFAAVIYSMWYFRFLVGCFCIATVLSFLGRPLMILLNSFRYKGFGINTSIAAMLTLLTLLSVFASIIYFGVPGLVQEAMAFSHIDVYHIADYYAEPIAKLENGLLDYGIIQPGEHIETMISEQIMTVLQYANIKSIAGLSVDFAMHAGMAFFVVLFVAFFLLKDAHLLYEIIDTFVPDKYLDEVKRIMVNSRILISRYFIGLSVEIFAVTILLSLGFWFVGFHSALLLGFVGGVMVILPYFGVIIGGSLGLMLCITGFLSENPTMPLAPIVFQFVLVFAIVKLIDDFVLQPLIYARSVKAHPLEIFFIILIFGKIAGIPGMIIAIPSYTILRIIAKEFFSKWKVVKKLTAKI